MVTTPYGKRLKCGPLIFEGNRNAWCLLVGRLALLWDRSKGFAVMKFEPNLVQ